LSKFQIRLSLRLPLLKKKRKNSSLKIRTRNRKEPLNSQMVDGNALNAKITTSKEEKTVIDAKKQEMLRIYQASQPIFRRSFQKKL